MKTLFKAFFVIVALLCTSKTYAFEPADYRWNITPSISSNFGGNNVIGYDRNLPGNGIALDASYRLNKKYEIGIHTSMSNIVRRCSKEYEGGYTFLYYYGFSSFNAMATATYNYRTSRFVELSAGIGVGWMYANLGGNLTPNPLEELDTDCQSFVFMPRIGVKVRSHVRFYLGYKWQNKANSHAFLSVGYTFGIKKF